MNVNFEFRPCMILETVEVLYAYVNRIPAQELTGDGPYCIPGWTLQQIINDCGAVLSDKKSILQYYFGRVDLQDEVGKGTCLARNIVYDTVNFSARTMEEAAASLCESWKMTRKKRLRPYRIGEFGMAYDTPQETEYMTLGDYIEQLPVPPTYRRKLLEAFAGYENSVEELVELISPVAERLEKRLQPWVEKIASLAEQWNECFQREDAPEYIQRRFFPNLGLQFQTYHICLRFMNCNRIQCCAENDGSMQVYLGVGVPVHIREKRELEIWELKALRLLGSSVRMRMFRALIDKPMSSREIAQCLELHLGAVSRDVASLFDAKLLTMVTDGGRIRYCANMEQYNNLIKHLSEINNG